MRLVLHHLPDIVGADPFRLNARNDIHTMALLKLKAMIGSEEFSELEALCNLCGVRIRWLGAQQHGGEFYVYYDNYKQIATAYDVLSETRRLIEFVNKQRKLEP